MSTGKTWLLVLHVFPKFRLLIVDSVYYFSTTQPGTGIFVPLIKATKKETPPRSGSSHPHTPGGLKAANQNTTNYTPPTPSLPKFSQSVGPGRAASPQGKRPRPSLPRPESPVRRLQLGTPRPSLATPGPKGPARYGSPSVSKFSQSVRGASGAPDFSQSVRAPSGVPDFSQSVRGDPNKRTLGRERKASIGPRSASALGTITRSTTPANLTDDDVTPVGVQRSTKVNGSIGSVSSFNQKLRPGSRAASRAGNNVNDEEVERLKAKLEDRDRQLKEQATALAEMEGNLTELQGLIEQTNGLQFGNQGGADDQNAVQLRALLREKNDKIALLTAEFDAHRADFRSTIDTLEMASTETERVYEKRIEELMQEMQELQDRTADVDNVANQLKQLEELVQELEEGLEDARRGEAEARGEVEFLRGEVERTRSELRREREKAQATMNGSPSGAKSSPPSKELEQKEDEIRGLKAIIHSLSRDSVPGDRSESVEDRLAREKLEREVSELRALVNKKSSREEELERELEALRRGSATTNGNRGSIMTVTSHHSINNGRNSFRDSRGTVVPAPHSPEQQKAPHMRHSRGPTLDTMPESDAYSSVTENSTLWCEICETSGHDILTCTNMFGPGADQQNRHLDVTAHPTPAATSQVATKTGKDVVREGLNVQHLNTPITHDEDDDFKPAPLSPIKSRSPVPALTPKAQILPNPMESGPVAGKESGVVDASKWCALCERDGHDSVDCPFEDAF